MKPTKPFVTVAFWRGTMHFEEKASNYKQAMAFASENQNAYPPHIYDPDGVELYDDGTGLHYLDKENSSGVFERVYFFLA